VDFSNKNIAILLTIGEDTIYLTQTHISTWVVMGILVISAVIIRIFLRNFKDIPGAVQNVIETIVEILSDFTKSNLGVCEKKYGGIYFSIFLFILASNLSGLFGLRPPTADLATTSALALITLILIHAEGIESMRLGYLVSYIRPYPVFLPINLIGEISKPLSLAFRLFGNMLGGFIIIGISYRMLPLLLRFLFPDILHAFFDLFAGFLQAFIFTMLSMVFIQQKASLL
jgi:F-type H+-transporting ATPase subunit a